MRKKYFVPFGRCTAMRAYRARLANGRSRPVKVEIGTPVAVPGSDWGCRVRIKGLSTPVDRGVYGVDAVQALELALIYSGPALSASAEFRAGRLEWWGERVIGLHDLALPLPLHSLDSALEQLQGFLRRLKLQQPVDKRWRRIMLIVMRNAAKGLAALAPPPRRREPQVRSRSARTVRRRGRGALRGEG